jgi:hypothetical protein
MWVGGFFAARGQLVDPLRLRPLYIPVHIRMTPHVPHCRSSPLPPPPPPRGFRTLGVQIFYLRKTYSPSRRKSVSSSSFTLDSSLAPPVPTLFCFADFPDPVPLGGGNNSHNWDPRQHFWVGNGVFCFLAPLSYSPFSFCGFGYRQN